MGYKNWKIARRMGLFVGLFVFLGSSMLYFITTTYVNDKTKSRIQNQMLDGAEDRAAIIETYISDAQDYLQSFGLGEEVKKLLLNPEDPEVIEAAQKYTDESAEAKGIFEGLYIAGLDSAPIVHITRSAIGKPAREGEKLNQLIDMLKSNHDVIDMGILQSPSTGKMVMALYYSIFDDTNTLIGYVGAAVYADSIMSKLQNIPVEGLPSCKYYLMNLENSVYLYTDDEELLNTESTDINHLAAVNAANQGADSGVVREDGEYLLVFQKLENKNWVFFVEDTESEVFADVHTLRIMLGIFFVVFLAIVITAAVIRLTKLGNEINKISKYFEKLGRLDLSPDDSLKKYTERLDEIGIISKTAEELSSNLSAVIKDAGYILEEIAAGNLTIDPRRNSSLYFGDFTSLGNNLSNIKDELYKIVGNITEASSSVSSGAEEISSGSQSLAQGATEQASSIEELAATIHTISDQINENAKYAKEADKKTDYAAEEMKDANNKMDELVSAMNEISTSSDETQKIIKTIEDIAFQTNILALNAAVEAARAGTAGKGFAVVADEVRNLAGKSAEAAQNTTALIENTVSAINKGNSLVSDVAQRMSGALESTNTIAELNLKIYNSSESAAESVNQVTQGIEQISGVVQTNSATAQQSAAASMNLTEQSRNLGLLIDKFKL